MNKKGDAQKGEVHPRGGMLAALESHSRLQKEFANKDKRKLKKNQRSGSGNKPEVEVMTRRTSLQKKGPFIKRGKKGLTQPWK